MNGWTIIQTFDLTQDAYMAQAYLESAGLETLLQDEMIAQVYSVGAGAAFGGIKLLVRDENVDEGVRILVEGGYLILENQKVEEDWVWVQKTKDKTHCPFCQSENIGKCKHLSFVAFLFFIIGIICCVGAPIFRATNKCYDCNKTWKYKRGKTSK